MGDELILRFGHSPREGGLPGSGENLADGETQVDPIARAEIRNHIGGGCRRGGIEAGAGAREDEDVRTCPAAQGVSAEIAIERVVARAGGQRVIALATAQRITAVAAVERVIAQIAVD